MLIGRREALERAAEAALIQAWHVGRFAQWSLRSYPSLDELLGRQEAVVEQSPEEMMFVMRAWSVATGGEIS